MGDKTVEITTDNFQGEVLESSTPVLIDFWAEWCGPCKMIGPIVDEIADEYDTQLKVGKLDADVHLDIMQQYGVMAIPTLILFKGGEPVERLQGFQPKVQILSKLEPHLG